MLTPTRDDDSNTHICESCDGEGFSPFSNARCATCRGKGELPFDLSDDPRDAADEWRYEMREDA